ncbi:hypothetical protein ACTWPB_07505 [Nocardia sp. IBHARD005]|uniref:hypothetical protein n=1 Tax=Nocardia sp. IBHARD005 TaxID=3457765 RepID=UPI0040581DBE
MSDRDTLAEQFDAVSQRGHGQTFLAPFFRGAVDLVLTAGWRPPAREITTAAELAELPSRSIVCDQDGDAWQRHGKSWDCALPGGPPLPSGGLFATAELLTLVYVPTEEA